MVDLKRISVVDDSFRNVRYNIADARLVSLSCHAHLAPPPVIKFSMAKYASGKMMTKSYLTNQPVCNYCEPTLVRRAPPLT